MMARLSRPIPSAHGLVMVEALDEGPSLVDQPARVGAEAEQLGQLADEDDDGQTGEIAGPHRVREQVGDEPQAADAGAARQTSPTRMASIPARAIACCWSPAASGRIVAAIIGPSDESGPRTRIGDGPTSA